MKFKYVLSLFLLFSVIISGFAQTPKELLCKILDYESKYPVSYATIKFEGTPNGVIADEEGEFRLPINYKESYEKIVISSIGFETLKIDLNTLKINTINTIYLEPKIEALGAVLISGSTKSNKKDIRVEDIVRNSIGKIPTNYPYSPHSYMSYYRDYQLVNNNYYNLNEAIVESFDAGFNTSKYLYKDNTSAIYSYNVNNKFYQDTLLLNSIYGKSKTLVYDNSAKLGTEIQNELEILNIHNPIRNYNKSSFSFIYVFRDDFVNNHRFKLLSVKYIDDVPLYEIEFITKENPNSKYMGAGKIYIAKSNFAIHKIEYSVFSNKNYNSARSKDNAFGNLSRKSGNILFEVTVEYKVVGNKMFLNYMTFNNRFIIKEPNPFKVESFDFDPNDQYFYIKFNKPVDESTIKRKSNFKLRYQDKKLIVREIRLEDINTVRIKVLDWSAGISTNVQSVKSEDFSYKLKKIKDTFGTVINKESRLVGYQFRELFTQEIFESKKLPSDLIFVNKAMPLQNTRVNIPNFNLDRYWVNSPLKQTKASSR
ncbi:carboxypeptidase-like regulatory domain-containing protein [Winogradskyella sp. PG-2]|uniref:carboxypeptidase-like regulatory domain-containing protein n=1 Tax=Winogradskyella sp. PG-2 TaxID=754409 RepID=UPI00045875BF|nr:carboxypeptidase-like regulatory domain-containing protein [Winogradskyella sp. PG-2]BAO74550.1 putative outer membrane protein [Winogradskyella sp. PG-2]